jgi:type IV pilus assembly protein PilY1
MKRVRFVLVSTLLVFGAIGIVFWSGQTDVNAQVMSDYVSIPPFVGNVVTPNILIVMDTSQSMTIRSYCDKTGEALPGQDDFDNCPAWDPNTTYAGIFDEMKCYTYNSAETRFEPTATAKTAVSPLVAGLCGATEWDGNLLNWGVSRRFESVKKAMIGGQCVVARAADGTCPPSGSPALITIKGLDNNLTSCCSWVRTPAVSAAAQVGRVPTAVQPGAGSPMYFNLPGPDASTLVGSFCTDNDGTRIPSNAASCAASDADAYAEQKFVVRAALTSEPIGVIQNVGDKGRFGLAVFKKSGLGGGAKVLTGMGSRQSMNYLDTAIETFNTNKAAMIDGVEEAIPDSGTPLAKSMYDAVRYVAQVNSITAPTVYNHPLAFSPGVGFGSSGVGSLGSGELSALTGSETCPAGYIANACGRDPFFFGSNFTPAWASPSALVTCCRTFIVLVTDGAPNVDLEIPAALQDYGHAAHGAHCTAPAGGGYEGTQNTCVGHKDNYGPPTGEVKASHYLDDVAYWGHINDLRQATIPVINEAGHDIPGFQNVTIYTFFAYGGTARVGSELLQTTAKLGAFEDRNGNNLPDLAEEYDRVNNYTGADGADGLPDGYFESMNANEMRDKLMATLNSILQRSVSGTAAAVQASSVTGEGAVYQAYFYPRLVEGIKQVDWIGYLHSLFVDAVGNLREDTDGDGKLIYGNDYIVKTRYDSAAGEVKADRYVDANGDGKADSATPTNTVALKELLVLWEAGKQLALKNSADRKILTWVDTDNDGVVDAGEEMAFSTANSSTLGPYIRAGAAPYTADNIINFIRGDHITGLRDRQLTVGGSLKVWKLGDIVHSTPTIVGAPAERHDVIYGDASYNGFFAKYKNRRIVAYAGANDGMLHAFNIGYYHRGDDPATTSAVEHGWFTRTPDDNASGPVRGEELWGFIPYQLLPQLQWLTRSDYAHVYYVDLKPKVTDVRIFTPDTDHPDGWGTILIGGFRMGGSCKDCPVGGGKEMVVNISGTNRAFYSAYFVLDITNPEADPKLLWSFTDATLGLATGYPAVLRVNPAADAKTSNTNAKWFALFGSGPTSYSYEVVSVLDGQAFAVDLKTGPGSSNANVTSFKTEKFASFMGDFTSLDANLDYRTDVVYVGSVIDTGSTPKWRGKLYRLTTGNDGAMPFGEETDPKKWGKGQKKTILLDDFSCSTGGCTGPYTPGPIPAAPTVTIDDAKNIWVFAGTGRLFHLNDLANTEPQYFFGVKDGVISGTCGQNNGNNCQVKDLVNVSNATICVVCAGGTNQVTDPNNTGVTTFEGTGTTSLVGLVQSKGGWYTTLPASKERVFVSPTLVGGTVFFPSYIPGGDLCSSGTGTSSLYALFYQTGSANKSSTLGTDVVGGNTNAKRSVSLGAGAASQVVVHIGAENTENNMTSRVKACSQMSTGALTCVQSQPALSWWSRMISWRDF